MEKQKRDPVLARMLRYPTGLREGGLPSEHEVLATYWSRAGEAVFALCRHGLLLRPGTDGRYIPYAQIADAGYHNREMAERAKSARASGIPASLAIRLDDGERIELPLEIRSDGMPDLLTIAQLIHRRAVLHRAQSAGSQS